MKCIFGSMYAAMEQRWSGEEFARVFQRFYRGKNAEDQEGVGLGLYLAREIIRGQRGYMKGEYDPEKGNVFSVFLCR